jgi:hypothetical protein
VDENVAGAFEALQDEAFAAEEAGAEPLGEFDVDVDVAGGAQERIALAEDGACSAAACAGSCPDRGR